MKENKAMSTPTQLFESIRQKNLVDTQNSFASLLEKKIEGLKEYKKMEVAANLFNMPSLQESVAGDSQQTVTDLKNPSLNDLKKLAGQVASAARLEGSQNTEDETFTKVLNAKVKEIGQSQGTPAKTQQQAANKIKQAVRNHDLMPGKSS